MAIVIPNQRGIDDILKDRYACKHTCLRVPTNNNLTHLTAIARSNQTPNLVQKTGHLMHIAQVFVRLSPASLAVCMEGDASDLKLPQELEKVGSEEWSAAPQMISEAILRLQYA